MNGVTKFENQRLFLGNALKAGKLSHAYLFCGADQQGITEFAVNFAKNILQKSSGSIAAKLNPDLIRVSGDMLKIENIRNLIAELYLKPYQSDYKVAVVESFENATPEAANSILKTLEEPSPSTIIILLARNKQTLLPTIISRCQVLYFTESPRKGDDARLAAISSSSDAEKLLAVKEFADMESSELQQLFEDWLMTERKAMLAGYPEKYSNVSALIASIDGIHKNLNKKMVLERLFLSCS